MHPIAWITLDHPVKLHASKGVWRPHNHSGLGPQSVQTRLYLAEVRDALGDLREDSSVVEVDAKLGDLVIVIELHDVRQPHTLVGPTGCGLAFDPALADDHVTIDVVVIDVMGTRHEELRIQFVERLDLVSASKDTLSRRGQNGILGEQSRDIGRRAIRVVGDFEVPFRRLDTHVREANGRRLEPFPLIPIGDESPAVFDDRAAHARTPERALTLACLRDGIEAAHPGAVIPRAVSLDDGTLHVGERNVPLDRYDRVCVVGGGNAAGHMAVALERMLGDRIDDGVVVTDHPCQTERIRQVEGSHPIPDAEAVTGTEALLELTRAADDRTLLIALISGGGSALLPAPAEGISLQELQTVTGALLDAGTPIDELNAVRKHLSAIKGGRLAAVSVPATVLGLVISDVIEDDLETIASGPLAPDPSSYEDALAVLDQYSIAVPNAVRHHLEAGITGDIAETPDVGSPVFDDVSLHVVANNRTALSAAEAVATERGYATTIVSATLSGEAHTAGADHAEMATDVLQIGSPVNPPAVILSGGETTVTVGGDGAGGPNHEFAVGAAIELADASSTEVVIGSVDTDGVDGNCDGAGGLVDGETVTDTRAARRALQQNDTAPYLSERGDQLISGFTGTNVNDLRVVVIPE